MWSDTLRRPASNHMSPGHSVVEPAGSQKPAAVHKLKSHRGGGFLIWWAAGNRTRSPPDRTSAEPSLTNGKLAFVSITPRGAIASVASGGGRIKFRRAGIISLLLEGPNAVKLSKITRINRKIESLFA